MGTTKNHDENKVKLNQLQNELIKINQDMLSAGFNVCNLRNLCTNKNCLFIKYPLICCLVTAVIAALLSLFTEISVLSTITSYVLGTRCILPNNYFIWEATRPVSDCHFCMNVTRPIILPNVTREQFAPYAYSSLPIIVKGAVAHWPAVTKFSFEWLRQLYESTEGAYESVEEDCQFLHFHSDFTTLRDVFAMSEERAKLTSGEKPWYIGWCSNNPNVLQKMRQHYPVPHFLPLDSELSNHEYIFMGYEAGATMHLDFISRLMWQAQLQGNKTWQLIPSPECQDVCQQFSFYVEPGDAMLLDTRVWYHGTTIAPGQFSLTIQSEYS